MALVIRCGTANMDDSVARTLSEIAEQLEKLSAELSGLDPLERHEVGNALAVVRACHEGIVDGLIEPSAQRLENMLASLEKARATLRRV